MLALIYAIAFGSLALQVMGLYGSQGIAPIAAFLAQVARNGGAIRYLAIPSLFWLASDDGVLTGMCFGGVILASILFLTGFAKGRHERLLLFLLYAIYLSYASAGQEFLSFQWDSLLLETGFLAIFLGRNRVTPWLFRWLVFRVYSLSGAVKLLSGDANWRNLSAVSFHWHTQPLPTVLAWYADKLPGGVQHAATWGTLAIELVLPFLIFFPRRIRQAGATGMIALQVLILLTGNYTFFNLLTIALCLFLFDDRTFARWIPGSTPENASEAAHGGKLAAVAGVVIVTLGLSHLWLTFTGKLMEPLSTAIRYTAPLEIVNTYGLFAVMTTQRNEIVLEGSDDGSVWLPYEFHHKPGDLKRAPTWVAPHQPRVDWQMWFAALGNYQSNSWFVNLALRVLEGSPAVQPFFAVNPFPQRPPRFIRAQVYEYKFSDSATHARSGEWWQREARGLYLPAVGLRKAESQSNQQLP